MGSSFIYSPFMEQGENHIQGGGIHTQSTLLNVNMTFDSKPPTSHSFWLTTRRGNDYFMT